MNLINRSAVRQYVLESAKAMRSHTFTRVGASTYVAAESQLRNWLDGLIRQHPSRGKTIEAKEKS